MQIQVKRPQTNFFVFFLEGIDILIIFADTFNQKGYNYEKNCFIVLSVFDGSTGSGVAGGHRI